MGLTSSNRIHFARLVPLPDRPIDWTGPVAGPDRWPAWLQPIHHADHAAQRFKVGCLIALAITLFALSLRLSVITVGDAWGMTRSTITPSGASMFVSGGLITIVSAWAFNLTLLIAAAFAVRFVTLGTSGTAHRVAGRAVVMTGVVGGLCLQAYRVPAVLSQLYLYMGPGYWCWLASVAVTAYTTFQMPRHRVVAVASPTTDEWDGRTA